MNLEDQKKRAVEFLHACDVGDVQKIEAHIDTGFHFQFMERAASWSVDGKEVSTRLDRDNFLKYGVTATKAVTRDGMHFKVHLAISEGPYVALFGESNATSLTGKRYNNIYCWRFTFAGDKVLELLEFCDTHHAHQVLFDQAP